MTKDHPNSRRRIRVKVRGALEVGWYDQSRLVTETGIHPDTVKAWVDGFKVHDGNHIALTKACRKLQIARVRKPPPPPATPEAPSERIPQSA